MKSMRCRSRHTFSHTSLLDILSLCVLMWGCSVSETCEKNTCFCVYHLLSHQSCFKQCSASLLLTFFISHFYFCHGLVMGLLAFSLVHFQSYKIPQKYWSKALIQTNLSSTPKSAESPPLPSRWCPTSLGQYSRPVMAWSRLHLYPHQHHTFQLGHERREWASTGKSGWKNILGRH